MDDESKGSSLCYTPRKQIQGCSCNLTAREADRLAANPATFYSQYLIQGRPSTLLSDGGKSEPTQRKRTWSSCAGKSELPRRGPYSGFYNPCEGQGIFRDPLSQTLECVDAAQCASRTFQVSRYFNSCCNHPLPPVASDTDLCQSSHH